MKTSSGKYIAPQPIEGKLKADELVGNAAVIGDSRKFAAVLISPDFQALGRWAGEHGVTTKDPKELVKDPKVKAQYESIVKRVNAELQDHETDEEGGGDAGGVEHRGRRVDAEHEAEAAGDLRSV